MCVHEHSVNNVYLNKYYNNDDLETHTMRITTPGVGSVTKIN